MPTSRNKIASFNKIVKERREGEVQTDLNGKCELRDADNKPDGYGDC